MRLREKTTVRNDAMIAARARKGWSQKVAAEAAGVSMLCIMRLEALDYSHEIDAAENSIKVAAALEIPIDDVFPEELVGKKLTTTRVRVADVQPWRLLEYRERQQERLICGPPDLERKEQLQELRKCMSLLLPIEQEVLNRHFEGQRDADIAREVKRTRERVRQIRMKAEAKIAAWVAKRGKDL